MDQELKSYLVAMEARLNDKIDALRQTETQLLPNVDRAKEHPVNTGEPPIYAEFRKWANHPDRF